MVSILILLYLVAAIAHLYNLYSKRDALLYVGIGTLIAGFVFHSFLLGFYYLSTDEHDWGTWLNSLAWAIVLLYLIVFLRYREMALGGFAVPAAFVLAGYATASPGIWGKGSQTVEGFLLGSHAVLAILSASTFFLLFAVALMFVVQSRELKSKRPGAWLRRLPPLDVLDDLSHKALYFGFTFLTASLFFGSMWAWSKYGVIWASKPLKIWPMLGIWLAYGVLLSCRLTRSWKGMRSAVFSMATFLAVLVALLVHI